MNSTKNASLAVLFPFINRSVYGLFSYVIIWDLIAVFHRGSFFICDYLDAIPSR